MPDSSYDPTAICWCGTPRGAHGMAHPFSASKPAPHASAAREENSRGQYIGADWRTALERNVTVSLEFAEHDLGRCEDCGQALALVREALAECRRLLAGGAV